LSSLIARVRRLPVVPMVLVGIVAVWLLWALADAALSVIRVGIDAVTAAPPPTDLVARA
jgi:hypothetical protein